MRYLIQRLLIVVMLVGSLLPAAFAQQGGAASAPLVRPAEQILGAGDVVRITVYQNPDLTVDSARISEGGAINFPLVGSVQLGGQTMSAGEQLIAKKLRDGGFVLRPQVTIQLAQIRSAVVSVLGFVTKPGRYPIDVVGTKVSEMIATAGGVITGGSDIVSVSGTRNGKAFKLDVDLPIVLQSSRSEMDLPLENGDILFVDRAPSAYIYGEVTKPGEFPIRRGMTAQQALAAAGGLTARGTERGLKVHRRDQNGNVVISDLRPNDPVGKDDVIYVKESLF